MSVLAVVDLLNSVPPGAAVPEGGVLFAMPAVVFWVLSVAVLGGVAVLARRMASEVWWRRLRRHGRELAAETLALSQP